MYSLVVAGTTFSLSLYALSGVFEVVPPGEVIWSATLTVEEETIFVGKVFGYSLTSSRGQLDPPDFSHGGGVVLVTELQYLEGGVLVFNLDGPLGSGNFKLYLDDTAFLIEEPGTDASLTFSNHGLDWEDGQEVKVFLAVNREPTGEPVITGDDPLQVGERLTADSSAIMDDDGLPEPDEFSYQWVRVVDSSDPTTDVLIEGATGSSYAPLVADIGHTLNVEVSYTDEAGFKETPTSDATAAVTPSPYGEVIWSATMTVEEFVFGGQTFFGYTNVNNRGSLEPITFSYGGANITVRVLSYRVAKPLRSWV